ncbi:MAG: hypothetical protein K2Q29_11845 [Sphingomonadales bacterium]|nr:hypothetical protein [Sphingomonadales bacterium]
MKQPKPIGHFALVDVPTVRHVAMKTDADTAAVYLTQALWTDATGRRSSMGREGCRKRLGLRWSTVDRSTRLLEEMGLQTCRDKSSRIVNVDLKFVETRPMRDGYHAGLERARAGVEPATDRERKVHEQLMADGWIDADGQVIETRPIQPAYMPLSLLGDVFGQPTGQPCIIERIRKARDPMAFLLLAQAYAAQNLPDLGGTDRRFVWMQGRGEKDIHRTADLRVLQAWDLSPWTQHCDVTRDHRRNSSQEDAQAYFDRVKILQDAGAIEIVIAAMEDDSPTAQMIYPLGVLRHGKLVESEPEHAVGMLAIGATVAMRGDLDRLDAWLDHAPKSFFAPVDGMYRKAVIRGIPRLVARPRTEATQRWQAERMELCREWIDAFTGIIAEHAPELLSEAGRLQGYTKVAPRIHQGDTNDLLWSALHNGAAGAARDDEAA